MGRKHSYELYRRKAPDGTPYGTFRYYNPGTKSVIDTGTEDESEASAQLETVAEQIAQPTGQAFTPNPVAAQAVNLDFASEPQSTTESDPIAGWATGATGNAASSSGPTPNVSQSFAQPSSMAPVIPIRSAVPPKKRGLTVEQIAKLASAVTKVCVRINVLTLETMVRLFGRDPYALDSDDLAIIALGWELQLEEWFDKAKIKPWVLISVGNLLLLSTMMIKSKKIDREQAVA